MIIELIKNQFSNEIAKLYISEDELYIELNLLVIHKEYRNQGIAREVMQLLCNYADSKNLPIYLSPEPHEFSTSLRKLISFYESFDFVPNKGRLRDYEMPKCDYLRLPQ